MFTSKAAYKFPSGIVDMFGTLREIIFSSVSGNPAETLER